jgi:cystathionine beta-synthase
MIEDAERDGLLKPGGTVIECTSGNTGMGLALACSVKGYKLICTMSDKQSKEKIDILRAMGAEVHVCPTNVEADHPDSYYSVAKRCNEADPNSFWCNQYDNKSNQEAHYASTGPEIWEQTEGPSDALCRWSRHGWNNQWHRTIFERAKPRRPDLGHRLIRQRAQKVP